MSDWSMSAYELAFDIGGTFIKSAVLDERGTVLASTLDVFPSRSKQSKEEILDHLAALCVLQAGKIAGPEARLSGAGFAFPGPFDYENGICYIANGDKFESLYGVNVRNELLARLSKPPFRNKLREDFTIAFENDAGLFALGEWSAGSAKPFRRCICITIGTGTGSAFLENGVLVKHRADVPANGWLYNQPFEGGVVDEHISRRGILRLARQFGFGEETDVDQLAAEALAGSAPAKRLFETFGERLGRMLAPYAVQFQADGIVVGGQIAKSHSLFDKSVRRTISPNEIRIVYSENSSNSVYSGIHALLRQKRPAK
ncbi:ROK family protein [Paenibacillus sp. 32O-W]|nr:ROK family protein [Paenibacillus sp. 32O-W]